MIPSVQTVNSLIPAATVSHPIITNSGFVTADVAELLYDSSHGGCPAVPQKESTNIITTIKIGTCHFIFHPSRNYLSGSKILNG